MKKRGNQYWEEFTDAVESFTRFKSKTDENLKKQGLHNIGCCHLCGNIHYTDDPILLNPKIN